MLRISSLRCLPTYVRCMSIAATAPEIKQQILPSVNVHISRPTAWYVKESGHFGNFMAQNKVDYVTISREDTSRGGGFTVGLTLKRMQGVHKHTYETPSSYALDFFTSLLRESKGLAQALKKAETKGERVVVAADARVGKVVVDKQWRFAAAPYEGFACEYVDGSMDIPIKMHHRFYAYDKGDVLFEVFFEAPAEEFEKQWEAVGNTMVRSLKLPGQQAKEPSASEQKTPVR